METSKVRAQLHRILAHPVFSKRARSSQFLRYVVDETLEGRGERIKAFSIALSAFGLPETFDAEDDTLVRVCAGRVRQQLNEYYSSYGKSDPVIIAIPKGRYVPTFKLASTQYSNTSLLLPVGDTSYGLPVLAVCQFEPISINPHYSQICNGLQQELVQALSPFEEVAVLPAAVAYEYSGNLAAICDSGKRAGADFVICGALQGSGQVARLFVNLVGVRTGRCIWSNSFDFDLCQSCELETQREIACEIAATVAQPFGHAHRETMWQSRITSINDLSVYECLLQAHLFNENMSDETYTRGLAAAQRAVRLAPTNAAAWAALSHFQTEGYLGGFGEWKAPERLLENSRRYAQKACELNPESASAHVAMATMHFAHGEQEELVASGDRAIALNPANSAIRALYGTYRAYSGDWDGGLNLIQNVMDRQPSHPTWFLYPFMDNAIRQGKIKEFLKLSKTLKLEDFHIHYVNLAISHSLLGEQDRAADAIKTLSSRWPGTDTDGIQELWRRNYPADLMHINKEGLNASELAH